jgi:hypothetical protein
MVPSLPDAREKYLASEKKSPVLLVFSLLEELYKYPEFETLSPGMGAGTELT